MLLPTTRWEADAMTTAAEAIEWLKKEDPEAEFFVQFIGREHGYEDLTDEEWANKVQEHEERWADEVSSMTTSWVRDDDPMADPVRAAIAEAQAAYRPEDDGTPAADSGANDR
jgi:hypothetical protein